jgi:hypothetical protein
MAAGTENPEDAITALINVFTTSLPAKLDALDTLFNDGITLADIAAFYRAPIDTHDLVPALVLAAEDTEVVEYHENLLAHRIEGRLILIGNDAITGRLPQEVLNSRLYRTMTGMYQVLRANPTLTVGSTANAVFCEAERRVYGETLVSQGMFRRDGVITLKVLTSPS